MAYAMPPLLKPPAGQQCKHGCVQHKRPASPCIPCNTYVYADATSLMAYATPPLLNPPAGQQCERGCVQHKRPASPCVPPITYLLQALPLRWHMPCPPLLKPQAVQARLCSAEAPCFTLCASHNVPLAGAASPMAYATPPSVEAASSASTVVYSGSVSSEDVQSSPPLTADNRCVYVCVSVCVRVCVRVCMYVCSYVRACACVCSSNKCSI